MIVEKKINHDLEALRGFAALIVFIYLINLCPKFNLGYDFRANFFPYVPGSHLMVLVFFMLLGYVIGLTNNESNQFSIIQYARKRLVRPYPVYLVAILIMTLLFSQQIPVLWGGLFFLQNLVCENLGHNQALWSLNHEYLNYTLAIPLLFFKWRPQWVICFGFLILCISLCFFSVPGIRRSIYCWVCILAYWVCNKQTKSRWGT